MILSPEREKDFNNRLQQLALANFEQFCKLSGVDRAQAFVCIERQRGKTIRQITISSGIPRSTVGDICKKCPR